MIIMRIFPAFIGLFQMSDAIMDMLLNLFWNCQAKEESHRSVRETLGANEIITF